MKKNIKNKARSVKPKVISKCTAKVVRDGKPGRPKAVINVPNKKFTFAQLCKSNPGVKPLTCRKFLDADLYVRNEEGDIVRTRSNSVVVLLRKEKRPPQNGGKGRSAYVYIKRAVQKEQIARQNKVSVTMESPQPISKKLIDATLTAAENADSLIAAAAAS